MAEERPWAQAFNLAWESFMEATTPVGALLLDAGGQVIASARGRKYARDPIGEGLRNSKIAHAELNLFMQVQPEAQVRDHLVLSTLEPCSMCVGACIQAAVGAVIHAGVDPYGGATSMVLDNGQTRRRRPTFEAEQDPAWHNLGTLLNLLFHTEIRSTRYVVDAHRDQLPDLVTRAEAPELRRFIRDAAASRASFGEIKDRLRCSLT